MFAGITYPPSHDDRVRKQTFDCCRLFQQIKDLSANFNLSFIQDYSGHLVTPFVAGFAFQKVRVVQRQVTGMAATPLLCTWPCWTLLVFGSQQIQNFQGFLASCSQKKSYHNTFYYNIEHMNKILDLFLTLSSGTSSARNENLRPLLNTNIPLISGKYGFRNHF